MVANEAIYPTPDELLANIPETYDDLLDRFNEVMLHYEE